MTMTLEEYAALSDAERMDIAIAHAMAATIGRELIPDHATQVALPRGADTVQIIVKRDAPQTEEMLDADFLAPLGFSIRSIRDVSERDISRPETTERFIAPSGRRSKS